MRRSRRDTAAALLNAPLLRQTLERLGRWRGVLVLNYHRVGDSAGQPWDRSLWSASAQELDEQLATLARHAEVIHPEQVSQCVYSGRGRRVLITFDDGYRDNYEIAFPLLRKHGLSATFFLATGFLDRPHVAWWDEIAWIVRNAPDGSGPQSADLDLIPVGVSFAPDRRDASITALVARYKTLPDGQGERLLEQLARASGWRRCEEADAAGLWMSWEMAGEMHAAGMAIGGHTVSHPVLARISHERQTQEIATCARRLREELSIDVRWFAYPVGGRDTFTDLTKEILREQGVELAFSFYGGVARRPHWDPLDVPRIHIGPGFTPALLTATISLPMLFARP